MDVIRVIISGILGGLLANFIIRWLGRRFPIQKKPHPLSWYEQRYAWVERVAGTLFLAGIGVSLLLYRTMLVRNDPRGVAVGIVLGCFLSMSFLLGVTAFSRTRSFREYWDYQELKYRARGVFSLYLVLPVLGLSIYGTIHLLVYGS